MAASTSQALRFPHPPAKVIAAARPAPPFRFGWLRLVAMGLCGGVAGYLFMPEERAPLMIAPVQATLDAKPLPLDGDETKTADAAHAIARAYVAERVTIAVPGGAIERTREELGARVDGARLTGLVRALRDPYSPLRRAHDQVARGRPMRLPLPVTTDARRALATLLEVKDELDRAPQDARFDLDQGKVLPDDNGRRVDVYATLARLDDAFLKGLPKIEAIVEPIPAQRTAAQLGDVRIDEVLGYFETKYARDNKHEARTFNLRLAASKLERHRALPRRDVRLQRDVVGPRNEANGYKVAPVIAQGELVDGVGGGTCQIAGTLHGAAFFAGLDIVERHPHTRPSFYIKMGMDAAVVYPAITLKLRNPFPFPVVLHETVREGIVRAEILGPRRSRDVTFVPQDQRGRRRSSRARRPRSEGAEGRARAHAARDPRLQDHALPHLARRRVRRARAHAGRVPADDADLARRHRRARSEVDRRTTTSTPSTSPTST